MVTTLKVYNSVVSHSTVHFLANLSESGSSLSFLSMFGPWTRCFEIAVFPMTLFFPPFSLSGVDFPPPDAFLRTVPLGGVPPVRHGLVLSFSGLTQSSDDTVFRELSSRPLASGWMAISRVAPRFSTRIGNSDGNTVRIPEFTILLTCLKQQKREEKVFFYLFFSRKKNFVRVASVFCVGFSFSFECILCNSLRRINVCVIWKYTCISHAYSHNFVLRSSMEPLFTAPTFLG